MQTNLQFWKIYLDTCCLSRLFDPLTQARVRQEAEAISRILAYFFSGDWHWISSKVAVDEVEQTPDVSKRSQIKTFLAFVHQNVFVGAREISRGQQLEALGFKEQDALHLACAESGEADLFLTTDDRLLKRAKRYYPQLNIRVENPDTWLQEVTENGHLENE